MTASIQKPFFLLFLSFTIILVAPTTSTASPITFDLTLYGGIVAPNTSVLGTGWITVDENDLLPGQYTSFGSLSTPPEWEISLTTGHGTAILSSASGGTVLTSHPGGGSVYGMFAFGPEGNRTLIFRDIYTPDTYEFVSFEQQAQFPDNYLIDAINFNNDLTWYAPVNGITDYPMGYSGLVSGQFYTAVERTSASAVPLPSSLVLLLSGLITGIGLRKRHKT